MRIAVLFDGAGLARLGLEQAGHQCTGFELNPVAHFLSSYVGGGRCVHMDVRNANLNEFDGIWASPPCQKRSSARTQGEPVSQFSMDLLDWSLKLNKSTLWVENVLVQGSKNNDWGTVWNAAQFLRQPIQNRNRVIGGHHPHPTVFREYRRAFPDICPCVTATEYKGCATDSRRASRFYGRRLTIDECAYHQGFKIPKQWRTRPDWYDGSDADWRNEIYTVIGNGVPVYMAKAFGIAASGSKRMAA